MSRGLVYEGWPVAWICYISRLTSNVDKATVALFLFIPIFQYADINSSKLDEDPLLKL